MLRSTLSSLRDWREYLTPVSHVSSFRSTGEITPDEFVTAGDYLVYKFPTWSWSGAPASQRRDFLPDDKQYLVTRHVPSHVRAAVLLDNDDLEEGIVEDGDEAWVTAGTVKKTQPADDAQSEAPGASEDEIEEIVDISDGDLEDDDDDVYRPEAAGAGNANTHSPTRTYNLFITYSTSYRVPKLYLSGFNADGSPLAPADMFDDIVPDYRDRTVTIEKAPWDKDLTLISIHPCRHANVMKVLLGRAEARLAQKASEDSETADITEGVAKVGLAQDSDAADGGDGGDGWEDIGRTESVQVDARETAIRIDQYLVIFLKFIASVTPGIEHDYTMTVL